MSSMFVGATIKLINIRVNNGKVGFWLNNLIVTT